jgi:hypothetical protein
MATEDRNETQTKRGEIVLQLLALGRHDADIARELGVSKVSARRYLTRLYTRRGQAGGDSWPATVELYELGSTQLGIYVSALKPRVLDLSSPNGGWSIRQIVHHIVDGDTLWGLAARTAVATPGSAYSQSFYGGNNRWAKSLDYANRPIDTALALLQANRTDLSHLVVHIPNSAERYVRVRYSDRGPYSEITVHDIFRAQATHLFQHLRDITSMVRESEASRSTLGSSLRTAPARRRC